MGLAQWTAQGVMHECDQLKVSTQRLSLCLCRPIWC